MNEISRDVRDYGEHWVAQCPRCEKQSGPSEIVCPNCKKPGMLFGRDWHSGNQERWSGEEGRYVDQQGSWSECWLECRVCRSKFKTFPCPHICGGILTIPCFKAFLAF